MLGHEGSLCFFLLLTILLASSTTFTAALLLELLQASAPYCLEVGVSHVDVLNTSRGAAWQQRNQNPAIRQATNHGEVACTKSDRRRTQLRTDSTGT